MGLSVVSQTRCKTDVFPEFALPITSTRNLITGIGGRLSAICAVRLCAGRLCAVPIGAVGEEVLIDRFRLFAQTTCSSHTSICPVVVN